MNFLKINQNSEMKEKKICLVICLFCVVLTLLLGCLVNFIWINNDYRQYIYNFHQVAFRSQLFEFQTDSVVASSIPTQKGDNHIDIAANTATANPSKPDHQSHISINESYHQEIKDRKAKQKGEELPSVKLNSLPSETSKTVGQQDELSQTKDGISVAGDEIAVTKTNKLGPEVQHHVDNRLLPCFHVNRSVGGSHIDSKAMNINSTKQAVTQAGSMGTHNGVTGPVTDLAEIRTNTTKKAVTNDSIPGLLELVNNRHSLSEANTSSVNATKKSINGPIHVNWTMSQNYSEVTQTGINITLSKVHVGEGTRKLHRDALSARLGAAIKEFRSHEDEWGPKVPNKYITDVKNGYIRAQMMRERCRLFEQYSGDKDVLQQGKFMSHSFFSNEKLRINICTNCKVASSTIREVMYNIINNKDGHFKPTQKLARNFTHKFFKSQYSAVPSFPNVTFVREPLERLLSAYLDQKGYKDAKKVSFLEFLQRVLSEGHVVKNRHLQSYTLRCRTCDNKFAFVGLQGTFDADISVILRKRRIKYSRYTVGRTHIQHSSEKLKLYYDQIPNATIHKLWEQYYIDYFLYGFPYPSHLLHS